MAFWVMSPNPVAGRREAMVILARRRAAPGHCAAVQVEPDDAAHR
jgi:hypothetical protein